MAESSARAQPRVTVLRAASTSAYTFFDEMWRQKTVHSRHVYSPDCGPGGGLVPMAHPSFISPATSLIPSRTAAERAEVEDAIIWASSLSRDNYEDRKQTRDEKRRAEREALMEPSFERFPFLPVELRLKIWSMALEVPMNVSITCWDYTWMVAEGGFCGTEWRELSEYIATAFLPPLMLISREAHQVAAAHCHRAFRGVNGGGGVMAYFPTNLTIDVKVLQLLDLPDDDWALIRECTLIQDGDIFPWDQHVDGQLRAILAAPRLEKLQVRARSWLSDFNKESRPPSLCRILRKRFQELYARKPDRNVPRIKVAFTTPASRPRPRPGEKVLCRPVADDKMIYSFDGSILSMSV